MTAGYKKVSAQGSVNIPVRLRRELGIQPKDRMEVEAKDGELVIRPYVPRCAFCGTDDTAGELYGKGICRGCAVKAYGILQEMQGKE